MVNHHFASLLHTHTKKKPEHAMTAFLIKHCFSCGHKKRMENFSQATSYSESLKKVFKLYKTAAVIQFQVYLQSEYTFFKS